MFKHYSMLAVQASLHDPTARCAAAAALRSRPFPRVLNGTMPTGMLRLAYLDLRFRLVSMQLQRSISASPFLGMT